MSAFDTIESLTTIKLGASAASLTLIRRADGSFSFTDADGKPVVVEGDTNDEFLRLYRAIEALV